MKNYSLVWVTWSTTVAKNIFLQKNNFSPEVLLCFPYLYSGVLLHVDHFSVGNKIPERALSLLSVMFKHKETPPIPFLVCADSQRSEASQLWKLVSMETRVERRVMMLLAEQWYWVNHEFRYVFVWMCGFIRDKHRNRLPVGLFFSCNEGNFGRLVLQARWLLRMRPVKSEQKVKQLIFMSNALLNIDWWYRLWQAKALDELWAICLC